MEALVTNILGNLLLVHEWCVDLAKAPKAFDTNNKVTILWKE